MPFDGITKLNITKQLPRLESDAAEISSKAGKATPIRVRRIPPWNMPTPDRIEAALTALFRARELLGDEIRWCKGCHARGWLDVPVQSSFARDVSAPSAQSGAPLESSGYRLMWPAVRSNSKRSVRSRTGMTIRYAPMRRR